MDLDALLLEAEDGVLDEAYSALQRSQVTHYELAGEAFTRQRLTDLFHLVVEAIATRQLASLSQHVDQIAIERFNHGFDISEVRPRSTRWRKRCGDGWSWPSHPRSWPRRSAC